MRFFLIILLLFLSACQNNEPSVNKIDMYNSSGDMVGTATLTEQPDGVKIKLKLEGLTPGFHGTHVHEYPKCEGPDFKSAGNHLNPEGKDHGLMHPKGAHLGDLPNIEADGDGVVKDQEIMLPEATLLEGKKSLIRGEGTSLIIDEGQDDGVSQPGGDSGARIICGEIMPKGKKSRSKPPTDPTQFIEKKE